MERKTKDFVMCTLFGLFFAAAFLLCVFLPKPEFSDSERRKLAPMPELSASTLLNGRFMSAFESYTQDAVPFRDQFRTLKALTATQIFRRQDNNGIYLHEGFASAVEYPLKPSSLDRAAARFRFLYDTYLTPENRVFFSIIPDKNRFLAEESGHLSLDYQQFEQQMQAKVDFAEYIPISDLLEREDYYHTDTHWRQEQILDVAQRLAQVMGVSIGADYKRNTLDRDFYGVYYGQAALPMAPDALHYLTTPTMQDCKVYDWQNNKEIAVYDLGRAMGKDPYELFLSGPLSLVTIENPHAASGRELVMFRDSFGSSIAPLLIDGYSKITLVDIRYIQPNFLSRWVDFQGCDVLFLYSTLVLNNSETFK